MMVDYVRALERRVVNTAVSLATVASARLLSASRCRAPEGLLAHAA